jgi:hypothetical protein
VILHSKLDKEKSKYAGLDHENGFGSTYLNNLQWLVAPAEKSVINMI